MLPSAVLLVYVIVSVVVDCVQVLKCQRQILAPLFFLLVVICRQRSDGTNQDEKEDAEGERGNGDVSENGDANEKNGNERKEERSKDEKGKGEGRVDDGENVVESWQWLTEQKRML